MIRLLAALLCVSGCAVAGDDTTPGDSDTHEDFGGELLLDVAGGEDPAPDICALLPSCGPCSLACDLEQLGREYVPDGTCVLFACTLTNGEPLKLHVCNPVGD